MARENSLPVVGRTATSQREHAGISGRENSRTVAGQIAAIQTERALNSGQGNSQCVYEHGGITFVPHLHSVAWLDLSSARHDVIPRRRTLAVGSQSPPSPGPPHPPDSLSCRWYLNRNDNIVIKDKDERRTT